MSCEVKRCVFERNKSIKTFLSSNHCFLHKYDHNINNIAFSSEKVVLSESGEKYAQAPFIASKTVNFGCWVDFEMREQQGFDFVTGGSNIKNYELDGLMFKGLDDGFSHHKTLIDELEFTCGLLWCFYQQFELLFWRHPFTTDDPLMSKW